MTEFDNYIDTIAYMKSFLEKGKRREDEWMIFEEFDVGVLSFFYSQNLEKLFLQNLIRNEESELAQTIRHQVVEMQRSSLWKPDLVHKHEAWIELFQLCTKLISEIEKRGIKIEIKDPERVEATREELQKEFKSRLLTSYLWVSALTFLAPAIVLVVYIYLIISFFWMPFNAILALIILVLLIRLFVKQCKFVKKCIRAGVFKDQQFLQTLRKPTIMFVILEILFISSSFILIYESVNQN